MSSTDMFIWKVEAYLMRKYGIDTAYRDMDALRWYIYTGRASASVLMRLGACKPYMIGRILHEGGSVDETIKRIRAYIGIDGAA